MHNLVPRGQYTSGKGSSAVGLTAYVTRDPETRQLVLQTWVLCFQTLLNYTYLIIVMTNGSQKIIGFGKFIRFEVSKVFLYSFSGKCVSHCLWVLKFSLHFFKEMPWFVGKSLILLFAASNYYNLLFRPWKISRHCYLVSECFFLSQQWCTCFEWQWYLLHWWVWQDEWQHQSSSSWGHGKYFHNGNQWNFYVKQQKVQSTPLIRTLRGP